MTKPWIAEVAQDPLNDWKVEYFGDEGEAFIVLFSGPYAEMRARAYAKWVQGQMDDEGAYEAGG
jgi:hypothetical protein